MSKRIFSLCLALAVMLVALPLLPATSTAGAESSTTADIYSNGMYFNVLNTIIANGVPAKANTHAAAAKGNWDDGASVNISQYATTGADSNVTVSFDEESESAKFVVGDGGCSEKTAANMLIKNFPDSTTNMISIHLDTTGIDASSDSDGYFDALVGLEFRWCGQHTLAGGTTSYFIADGSNEVETIFTSKASNRWNQKTKFKLGVSGTYYIPIDWFGPTTSAVSGYDETYSLTSSNLWTELNADAVKVFEGKGYWMFAGATNSIFSSLSFAKMTLSAGDTFLMDDVKFLTVENTDNNDVFTIKDEVVLNVFNDVTVKNDGVYYSSAHDPGASAEDGSKYYIYSTTSPILSEYDANKKAAKFSYVASSAGEARVLLKDFPNANTNMVAFHLDATNVTAAADDYFSAYVTLNYRSMGAHSQAGGSVMYFRPDGADWVETITVTKASSHGNQRTPFKAGVSGTYYIPASAFGPVTDSTASGGYTQDWSSTNWTVLTDLLPTTEGGVAHTWSMDSNANNSGDTYLRFSSLTLQQGDVFYIDDVRFLEADYIDQELENNEFFGVKSEIVANNFPRYSKQIISTYSYDPGAISNPQMYGNSAGKTAYDYDSTLGAAKFSYDAEDTSGKANTATAYIKSFTNDNINMISVRLDLTNMSGDDNGKLNARISMGVYSNGNEQLPNKKFYFVPDATENNPNPQVEVYYTTDDPQGSNNVNNVRTPLQAGRSGTYYFPDDMFGDPSADGYVNGYSGVWDDFDHDLWTNTDGTGTNSWYFDKVNYSRTYFSISYFDLNEGEYFYMDDLKWVEYVNNYKVTYTDRGEVLGSEIVEENTTMSNVPADPERYGYVFNGWSEDTTAPVTAAMTVDATWNKNTTEDFTYNVSLGKDVSVEVNVDYANDPETINYDQRVKLTAPAFDGDKAFSYWTADGAIFSYNAQTSFLIFGDVEMVPVYGEEVAENPVVVYNYPNADTTDTGSDFKLHIQGVVSAEDASRITDIGILITNVGTETVADGNALRAAYYDAEDGITVIKQSSSIAVVDHQFHITVSGIPYDAVRTAAVYAVVDDEIVVSSFVCSATVATPAE